MTGYDAAGKPIYRERKTDISEDGEILAMTTNYTCNEFLDAADLKVFENMKKNNPRRYAVAGLGGWGITDGLVYENWKEMPFRLMTKEAFEALEEKPEEAVVFFDNIEDGFGLDFGYTNDPTAAFIGFIDTANKKYMCMMNYTRRACQIGAYTKKLQGWVITKTASQVIPQSRKALTNCGVTVCALQAQKGQRQHQQRYSVHTGL